MEDKVAKLIDKLRMKFPEQLKKEPLLDQLESEMLGEEDMEMDMEEDMPMEADLSMEEDELDLGKEDLEDEDELDF